MFRILDTFDYHFCTKDILQRRCYLHLIAKEIAAGNCQYGASPPDPASWDPPHKSLHVLSLVIILILLNVLIVLSTLVYHYHHLSNIVLKGLFVLFILIILVLQLHAIKVFGTGINMFAKRFFLLVAPGRKKREII